MALMSKFGAGFVFNAVDRASPIFRSVGAKFGMMSKKVIGSSNAMGRGLAPLAAGLGLFKLGTGLTSAAKGFADAAGSFEQSLKGVGVITRSTSEEFKLLHDSAIDAAAKTQFSPDQAVEGLTNLATAGLNARQATTALIPVLDLATGSLGQLGLAEAANAVVGTIKAYGMEAGKAGYVTDRLLRITQLTNFQARDFATGLSRAAATAKLYGQNLDDTLITMGLIRNMNIDATVASTSLREAWRRLASDERSQQLVAKQGVKIFDERSKKIRPMLDIMTDLAEKTENLNDKERMRTMTLAFGVRGMAAFNAVAQAQKEIMIDGVEVTLRGAKAVRALRDEMAGAEGTAEKFKEELLDTYQGQKQLIGGMIQTIKVLIGEGGTTALKPVAKVIYEILDGIRGMIQAMPVGARATIISALGALGTFIAGIGGVMAMVGALGMLGVTLSGVLIGIAGLALAMGPAVILFSGAAVAIASFAMAFKRNVGGIGDSWASTVDKLKLGGKAIVEYFSQGSISKAVQDELNKAENQGIKKFVDGAINGITNLKVFWEGLKEGFIEGVDALAPSLKRLTDSFSGIFDLFDSRDPAGKMAEWSESGKRAGRTLASFGEKAISALETMMEWGSRIKEAILSITGKDVEKAIADFKQWFNATSETVKLLGKALWALTRPIKWLYVMYKDLAALGGFIGDVLGAQHRAGEKGYGETFKELSQLRLQGGLWGDVAPLGFLRPGGQEAGGGAGMAGAAARAPGGGTQRADLERRLQGFRDFFLKEGRYATREGLAPGAKYFEELSAQKQDELLQQFIDLNRQLKKLGGQPIVLKIDNKEVARANRKGETSLADEEFGL